MDPEQPSPEVWQMVNALGANQGQPNMFAPPPSGPTPDMAPPEAGFGGLLPGIGDQVSSMGNEAMPIVPPPAMNGTGFAGPDLAGQPPEGQNGWGGMPPDVAQMVESLRGGGGPGMDGDTSFGSPGLDAGLAPTGDAGNAGQWSPGTGQVPDFSQAVTPQGAANGRGKGNQFGSLGQGQ